MVVRPGGEWVHNLPLIHILMERAVGFFLQPLAVSKMGDSSISGVLSVGA